MTKTTPRARIGIDVGGTFTDFVLLDGLTGRVTHHKEPSVPADPSLAVARGIPTLLGGVGLAPGDVEMVVHGTTIGLNATIQRKGAKLGLVTSPGGRGVLEIARSQMPDAFDYLKPRERALVPRDRIHEVSARISHDGKVLAPLDEAEIDALATRLGAQGVEAVTVLLLHSYAHPAQERALRDGLARRLPDVSVNASADIWPEKREYERCMLALINAFTQPLMEQYYDRLRARVAEIGVTAPIFITANNGGMIDLATARARPIETILSGPASGVEAAGQLARELKRDAVLTVDMGGTSADMALIRGGKPMDVTTARVGDFPLSMPVVGVSAIGAGGGSLVRADALGMLHVGPESAGAAPGPVCYGQGGTVPAVTDCYLVTGLIAADRFLGGRMALDMGAARSALAREAPALGLTGEDAAEQVALAALRVSASAMAADLARSLARTGDDARDFSLLAFGGAGPTHAALVAEEAGIREVIVPPLSSTLCSLGAAQAQVKRDFVASHRLDLAAPEAATTLAGSIASLEAQGRAWLGTEIPRAGGAAFTHTVEMRYRGQGFDLSVTLPEALVAAPTAEALAALFHDRHEAAFGYCERAGHVILSALRCRLTAVLPAPEGNATAEEAPAPPRQEETRRVVLPGGPREVPVLDRAAIAPGTERDGPLIVEQGDGTTWVPPGWHLTCAPNLCLILTS
ncbi:hydantoinase/oxoprolinase family protein [Pseudoroseicyclus sp. CXY001]|uniref:hydantoinase/oxoprolinase family protein n=1 Tax=Pseudoroseicyclus sp. CXY001 TaxID=3242492 RepID=UPI003570F911